MRSHARSLAALVGLVSFSGCLSNHPTARHAAMIVEGTMVVGGLGVVAATPSTPCQHEGWEIYNSCDSSRFALGMLSTGLILGGLVALLVTTVDAPPEHPAAVVPKTVVGPPGGASVLLGMPLQPKL
ncbi:MAG: hypothetical protein ABJE66_10605 [Deltaproteobacteria bacterium]